MSIEYVLDASAVLALIFAERGHQTVEPLLPVAAIGAVNAAEVLTRLIRLGATAPDAAKALDELHLRVRPFGLEDALAAARLDAVSRACGLSLGDRACLALAQRLGVPAVTADRNWRTPKLGVRVRLLR